jgi:hypothetical protein
MIRDFFIGMSKIAALTVIVCAYDVILALKWAGGKIRDFVNSHLIGEHDDY